VGGGHGAPILDAVACRVTDDSLAQRDALAAGLNVAPRRREAIRTSGTPGTSGVFRSYGSIAAPAAAMPP
jgi:hypothetical protein